ncbi:HNH endonuclease signature motif containing protein [Klenkia sp. LSe6-5]|uniref:HNH endonuclease signature motif containing protein n=1 Tax=Klenkia sesuvii TaxID=3103137 RepID=A0ABU8DXP3_9ACTN
MTTGRRFWVEVLPRFAAPVDPPAAEGAVPRLTALAVAAGLDGAELDAELASVHRQRSSLAAYELGLIERKAALGARQPLPFAPVARAGSVTDLLDEEEALQACDDFLPEEVAVLLGTSVPSTRYHVEYALTLVRQLPAVWHALADQRIDESAARAIVKALKHQAASAGGPVDDGIVDALAGCGVGWAERGCGPTALHDRLLAALIAADPAAADRRRETSKRGADAIVVPTGDGLGELRLLHVDVADLKLARAQVNAYARALKADGDERPIGQIRIAVILALIMRPWEARDPAVAHLTVNADLADLLLPDLEDLIPDDPCDEDATTSDEATDSEATDDEATDDEATDGEATDDEATDDEAADDEAADGEAAPGETARVGTQDREGAAGADAQAGGGDLAASSMRPDAQGTGLPGAEGTGLPIVGSQVGDVDGQPVSPAAVKELLRRIDALGLTHPAGGHLAFTITGTDRRLLAVATPEELEAAARTGHGLGPPPATPTYRPTAAQYRYLRARDRHCRFPGCRQTALRTEADHVVPYDHRNPARGGRTCVRNLALLCKRHHLLKTHAPGWAFRLDPDGTLHVTTPGGTTRTTTPPAADDVLDLLAPPPHDPTADPPPF